MGSGRFSDKLREGSGRFLRLRSGGRHKGTILAFVTKNQMPPHDPSKPHQLFPQTHCWISNGRLALRRHLWGILPGMLLLLSVAAVAMLTRGDGALASYLPQALQRQFHAATLLLLPGMAIGLFALSTWRSHRAFRAHLLEGELTLAQTHSILTASRDGVLVLDEHGRIQSINPAGETIFGEKAAKLIGQNLALLVPDRTAWQDRTLLPRTVVSEGRRQRNESFPLELDLRELNLEGRPLIVALVRDGSEAARATEALRQIGAGVTSVPGAPATRGLLRQLAQVIAARRSFIVELVGEGSSATAMLTLCDNGELRSAGTVELHHSACAEVLGKGFRALASGAMDLFPDDTMLAEYRATAFAALPLVDHRGRPVGVIGVLDDRPFRESATLESTLQIFAARAAADIERKRSEEALSAEKERLAVTLRSIGDGCITLDNDGRVMMFNPVAERLTGWIHEDASGRLVNEVLHLVDVRTRRRSQHLIQRIVTNGMGDATGGLNILISRDAEERVVETSSSPIRDRTGRKLGAIIVLRDVTERQRADEERQKADKLESLGLVAGGIAHDFNNILTTILGNVSLALGGSEVPPIIGERLTAARKAAQRAQELAGQLLTFAKGGAPIKQPTNLAQLLSDTISCAVTNPRITCDLLLTPDLWPIEADPGQLSQVIANIAANAEQAMPSGGTIHVTADNLDLPVASVSLGLATGRWVHFSVQDHGVGIPEQYLKKIFDPYFTTKPTGSGMGLATAYSVVKNHGGVILVESTPGQGSHFDIYLPASEKPIATTAAPLSEPPAPVGSGRVLVLDDEEAICMLVTCALEPLGYEVTEAQDGLVALEKYADALNSGKKFDLVISDLTMPGRMSGQEAIRRLRDLDPQVLAIVSSGYANDPVMSRYQEFGFSGMIAKPYEIDALGRKVAEVMAQGPNAPRVIYHTFDERKTA
jgi:PAS domain S-box-containing protein